MQVHVGPEWYLERQDFALHEHEVVQVTGALTEVYGQAVPRDCVGGGAPV